MKSDTEVEALRMPVGGGEAGGCWVVAGRSGEVVLSATAEREAAMEAREKAAWSSLLQ